MGIQIEIKVFSQSQHGHGGPDRHFDGNVGPGRHHDDHGVHVGSYWS